MKMRRARQRKKLIASSSPVEVWAAGVSSGPSYEAFTIPTPRGLSTFGTSVDTNLTGRKRPASNAEQSHDSASFGTLLQHVVVERADVKDAAFDCEQHSQVGGMGSARPSKQASNSGVKQIVLRLSGLRQRTGEPPSILYGEPAMSVGAEAEPKHETTWSNASSCIENGQNDHIMNTSSEFLSSSQGAPVKLLHPALQIPGPKEEFVARNENIKLRSAGCGDDSGACVGNLDKSSCVLGPSNGQARSGFGEDLQKESFPHPSNLGWPLNATNVCRSFCVPPSLNSQTLNSCNACTATRFSAFQQSVPRSVHYLSGEDVMVCPAPWLHERRDENYQLPDPMYPPGHCNGFSDDLDMETQRHLEEKIAQEILLLSQKLANLQARYGARRPVHNNTKPAVLSCPLTPLLSDIPRRDGKSNPRASSSSRIRQRSQLEEKKLGAGRNGVTNTKAVTPTPAQSSNKASDSGVQTSSRKSFSLSRALSGQGPHMSGNSAAGSRANAAQNGCLPLGGHEPIPTAQGGVEVGKSSKNSRAFPSPHRKRRDRQAEGHVEECSYSDDMKDRLKNTGGSHVQGYPGGSKRFDWVKTLRIGGLHETQSCTEFAQGKTSSPHQESEVFKCFVATTSSVSKSVQTTQDCCTDPKTSGILQVADPRTRTGKAQTVVRHTPILRSKSKPSDLEDLQLSASVGEVGVYDSRTSSFPTALKAIGESESRLKRRPDSSSIETRPGKSGKRTLSSEEMGGLDSRINYHLLKAGLRRAPSLRNALRVKKKTFGSRSPRKDGGKRLRTRTLLDLNWKAYDSAKVVVPPKEKLVSPPCNEEDRVDGVQRRSEVADCDAEYETFVESTDHVASGCEKKTTSNVSREVVPSEREESILKRRSNSPSRISTLEAKAKLSESPVFSLMKTQKAPRKTFIRCIDLVVATKKKSQLSKLNGGRKATGVRYAYRRVDCSKSPLQTGYGMDEGCLIEPQVNGGAVCQTIEEPSPIMLDSLETNPSTTTDTKDGLLQSQEFHFASDADPSISSTLVPSVSHLAAVLSRVIPLQMESMDAAQLRARWAELIDALENERLGLPKIKTSSSSSKMGAGSPRDSGGVKRVAEQGKSAHAGNAQQGERDGVVTEEVPGLWIRARPLWSTVKQKPEAVF